MTGVALVVAGSLLLAGGAASKARPPHEPSATLLAVAVLGFVPAVLATLFGLILARPWSIALAAVAGAAACAFLLVLRHTYAPDAPGEVDDHDGDGSGGGGGRRPDGPRDPEPDGGGLSIDWDAFESQAHDAWQTFAEQQALQTA